MFRRFPEILQSEFKDCGPTCLRIVAQYYKKDISINQIRSWSGNNLSGTTLRGLVIAAENIGFNAISIETDFKTLKNENFLPCVAYWKGAHFLVVYKITNKKVYVSDPEYGLASYSHEAFIANWTNAQEDNYDKDRKGILLLLFPTPKLEQAPENKGIQKRDFSSFFYYVNIHRKLFIQIFFGLLSGTVIAAIIPFLTQSVVDIGIQNRDINFIYLIFLSQFLIFTGKFAIDIIRGWIVLHLNTRIGISLVSDFLIKLLSLPISYFDKKNTGDVLQRITDHKRIESLITNEALSILFSFFNLIIFSIILATYNNIILMIFVIGSISYISWILLFLKRRRELDQKRFQVRAKNNNSLIELISGVQDIKLLNAESPKRWEWERIQAEIFQVSKESLTLAQIQGTGSMFINQMKNLSISFFTAKLVIDGSVTLGMMLSISYIVGQLSSPVARLIGFINTLQDASLSLRRVNEIYELDSEDIPINEVVSFDSKQLQINNASFKYPGSSTYTLKDINLTIPENKVTAIVGMSGSGKSTLLKLLLKFYSPLDGHIKVGNTNLAEISPSTWRSISGVVMQNGVIFSGTLLENIVMHNKIDYDRVNKALSIACLEEYIDSLPEKLDTHVSMQSQTMSAGQKQRLLIARTIYHDPQFIFFDEATSALDTKTEHLIIKNLKKEIIDKTAVIITHRLSTIQDADQIIVLDNGYVRESGNHEELLLKKGVYFELISKIN